MEKQSDGGKGGGSELSSLLPISLTQFFKLSWGAWSSLVTAGVPVATDGTVGAHHASVHAKAELEVNRLAGLGALWANAFFLYFHQVIVR